jgi:hypothetical protein
MEQQFDQSELSETVESRILGVAEKIIEDEEAKRKEELVSLLLFLSLSLSLSLSASHKRPSELSVREVAGLRRVGWLW